MNAGWFDLSVKRTKDIQAFFAVSVGNSKQVYGIARGLQGEFALSYADMFPLNPASNVKRLNDLVFASLSSQKFNVN